MRCKTKVSIKHMMQHVFMCSNMCTTREKGPNIFMILKGNLTHTNLGIIGNNVSCRRRIVNLNELIHTLSVLVCMGCRNKNTIDWVLYIFLLRKIHHELTSMPVFLYFVCGSPPQHGC